MPRKPWIIVLLSLVYVLSPVFILISNSWINMVPLWGPSGILNRLSFGDWFILSLYLINGIAIFTVKKTAWWVFLGSSFLLIIYNIWGYLANPLQPLPALLFYNLFLFFAAALFFRKEIIAPYFNPRLRWWESDPRYSLDFFCTIDLSPSFEAPIRDISQSGCFISTLEDLPLGVDIPMELHLQKISIRLNVRAIRKAKHPFPGWGLQFHSLGVEEEEGLHRLLHRLTQLSGKMDKQHERREFPRLSLPQWIHWQELGIERTSRLLNLSKTGCCLLADGEGFNNNQEYLLNFPGNGKIFPLRVRSVWREDQGASTKCGLVFLKENPHEKHQIRSLLNFYREAGAEDRSKTQDVNMRMIHESLKQTPFPNLYLKHKG